MNELFLRLVGGEKLPPIIEKSYDNPKQRLFDKIFCEHGRHSWKRNQIHKFNGGNTCWLCRNCRLIVRYDSLN